jgi:CheY-like chemotaxis protein
MGRLECICIIDDDDIYTFLLKKTLLKSNICSNIKSFENGLVGLEGIKKMIENEETLPDLILLDINMPLFDGWEFLEFFSEKYIELHKKVKIALLSSSVNPDDKTKADSNPFVFTFIDKALGMDNLNNLKEHAKLKDYFISQA